MNTTRVVRRALVVAGVFSAGAAFAGTSSVAAATEEGCAVADVDYAVQGSYLLKDTQFGAADGVYPLGTGRIRVRFEPGVDAAHPKVRLMSYELDTRMTVKASFAFWSTKVVTDSHTSVSGSPDGAARGTYTNGAVVWSTPVAGYHSDGTLHCEGNVCGNFGAPPEGTSPLHEPARAVTFKPFRFGPDGHTFQMDYAQVSHSDSPRQTGYLGLSGRETKRTCVSQQMASL